MPVVGFLAVDELAVQELAVERIVVEYALDRALEQLVCLAGYTLGAVDGLDLSHRQMDESCLEVWIQVSESLDGPLRVSWRPVSKPHEEEAFRHASHASAPRKSFPLEEVEETWAVATLAEDRPLRRDEASWISCLDVEQDCPVVLVAWVHAPIVVDVEEVDAGVAQPSAEV